MGKKRFETKVKKVQIVFEVEEHPTKCCELKLVGVKDIEDK